MRYYPAGARSRRAVIRGTIAGRQREIATDARDQAAAGLEWRALLDAAGREPGAGTPRTFAEVAEAWIAARRPGKRDAGYARALAGRIGTLAIEEVRPLHIAEAANALYPGRSAQTLNRYAYAPAAAILHFAHANGLRDYQRIARLKEPAPPTRRPAPGTAEALLAATAGDKRRLLLFLFCQGWRISEALGLKWEHVSLKARTLDVWVGKTGRWKQVAMHDQVLEALAPIAPREPGAAGPVFPWRTRAGVYKWLRPLAAGLGVKFTPHMARHEFGGGYREAGATSRDLVDLGTWTSPKSTERYQHAGTEHARALLARRTFGGNSGGKRRKAR